MSNGYESAEEKFLEVEYGALRKEVDAILDEYRTLERNGVIGVAIAYAWLATHASNIQPRFIWFLPVLIPLWSAHRNYALGRHLLFLGDYLLRIEGRFLKNEPGGWERYLRGKNEANLSAVSWSLWVLLTLASAALSVVGYG